MPRPPDISITAPDAQNDPPMLKLGVVPYLNVRPLVWAFADAERPTDVTSAPPRLVLPHAELFAAPPRALAGQLREGRFDAAIVPVFEFLSNPVYTLAAGAAIGCLGPVKSVVLFSETPLDAIRHVRLDTASLTSVHLLAVLAAEMGLRMTMDDPVPDETKPARLGPGEARLMIGDPALARRGRHAFEFDLGELWADLTGGLPFVFASWCMPPATRHGPVAEILRRAKVAGVANLTAVAREAAVMFDTDADNALDYFTNHIRYDFGEPELAGLREFARLCAKHGHIAKAPDIRLA